SQIAVLVRSEAHLRTAFELLQPRAHLNSVWGLIALTFGPPVSMTLGALAAALGEPQSAVRQFFEAAAERAAGTRAPVHAAWVSFHYGQALLGPLKNPHEGRRKLETAREQATALKLGGLVERVTRALEGQTAPAKVPPSTEISLELQGADWCVRCG